MAAITALNVSLGMDASNFVEGANLARAEVNRVNSIMRQSVPPSQKLQNELELLNKTFSDVGKQTKEYANAVEFLNKKHQQGKYSAEAVAAAQERDAQSKKAVADAAMQVKRAEDAANATMEKGRQLTVSLLSPQEQYNRKQAEYNRLLRAGAVDSVTYRRAMAQAKATLDATNVSTHKAATAQSALLGRIKGVIAAYAGMRTIGAAVRLATEAEGASVAFEVLTGSVKNANILMQQVRSFSDASPITFGAAQQAARQMLQFNIPVQQVAQNLQMLSDVTGGNNERFKMLGLAFSQMSAAGRLMGQDLLQMINAGFNPLQQISKTTGEDMLTLKKRMEEGGISAEEVRKAFEDATGTTGMYNGMTERLAETMGGKLNIAMSNLEKAGVSAGEAIAPLIISMTDGFNESTSILNDMISLLGTLTNGLGLASNMIKDMFNAAKSFDFEAEWTQTNKFLDLIEAKEREMAERKRTAASEAFDMQEAANAATAAGAAASEDAAKSAEKEADAKRRSAEASKAAWKDVADIWKQMQEFEKNFSDEVSEAMQGATAYFAEQKQRDDNMRKQVSAGPQSMELGSAESARFMADQANAAIGAAAVPEKPSPGEKEIADKTRELLLAQREANAKQETQLATMKEMLAEFKQNGFRRVR